MCMYTRIVDDLLTCSSDRSSLILLISVIARKPTGCGKCASNVMDNQITVNLVKLYSEATVVTYCRLCILVSFVALTMVSRSPVPGLPGYKFPPV